MAGKASGKKSRLSGRRGPAPAPSAKRHKGQNSIRAFLQRQPPLADRDSSSEPEEQGPSQTPAAGLLAGGAAPPSTGSAPTAAGAKLQTVLLNSLRQRFATQQALETPAMGAPAAGSSNQLAAGGGGGTQPPPEPAQDEDEELLQHEAASQPEGDDDDGFQIFSQLAYEPAYLSQRPPEPALELPDGTSQLATQTQLAHPPSSQQAGAAQQHAAPAAAAAGGGEEEDDGGCEYPASQHLSQPATQQGAAAAAAEQAGALRRASGVSVASMKTTPALRSAERVQTDGSGASGQKFFPLFRPRCQVKLLYIVRHGESAYNAAVAERGSGWADPQIYDAQLTVKGQQQACALREQLAALNLPADTLWLTSPLQRAMQTLLLACPVAHLLAPGGGGGGSGENSSAVPNGGERQPSVAVLPSISEKVATCGDVGHPASELRRRFPQLAPAMAGLPERWWHAGAAADKPNCALQRCFGSHEPKQAFMARIGAFRRWLQERPESVVVAVGHSSYWRAFEEVCRGAQPERMHNCEFRLIHF